MSIDLMPGFGAFTPSGGALPSFPAASAVVSMASPYWTDGHGNLDRTSSVADPAGGNAAEQYIFNDATSVAQSGTSIGGFTSSRPPSDPTYNSGTTYTPSVIVKAIGAGGRYLRFNHFRGSDYGCRFDLQAGTVLSYRSGGGTETASGITNLGSGWFQCWYTFTLGATGTMDHQVGCTDTDAGGDFDVSFTPELGDGYLLFRYQVVTGTDPNG
jgi:hypothetical protein